MAGSSGTGAGGPAATLGSALCRPTTPVPRPVTPLWPAAAAGALPPSPDVRPLDAVATRRAHEMVAWRGGFDASGVTVEVRGGTATLAGTVASAQDAAEARRLAASVRGVREVRDRLRVEQRDGPAARLFAVVASGRPARPEPDAAPHSFTFDEPRAA